MLGGSAGGKESKWKSQGSESKIHTVLEPSGIPVTGTPSMLLKR